MIRLETPLVSRSLFSKKVVKKSNAHLNLASAQVMVIDAQCKATKRTGTHSLDKCGQLTPMPNAHGALFRHESNSMLVARLAVLD